MDGLDKAIDQLLAAGLQFKDGRPLVDSKIHRCGYGKSKDRGWYVLHEYRAKNGRVVITGAFGIWGLLEPVVIEADWQGIDPQEAAAVQQKIKDEQERAHKTRVQRAKDAAKRARIQWESGRAKLKPDETHGYLVRKGVDHEAGVRFLPDGSLAVPMIRYDVTEAQDRDPYYQGPRRLVGLQKILPDGTKRFNKGTWKEGAACRLGRSPKDGEPFALAEGYATALSIRKSIQGEHAVFVCFDAYNLLKAGLILRKLFPRSPILITGDDDFTTVCDRHKAEGLTLPLPYSKERPAWCQCNPGMTRAHRAAEALSAHVVLPQFGDKVVPIRDGVAIPASSERIANGWTDFNDLHQAEGIHAVQAQIAGGFAMAKMKMATPASMKKPKGGGKGEDKAPDWELHGSLVKRFTLIYPSNTAFDHVIGEVVRLEHMALHFGDFPVRMWLESKDRRTVLARNVVFDPTMAADPAGTVNLYRGLALEPDASGSCKRVLALLRYLCDEQETSNTPISDWVLKWAALPLQRPGAKMQTAIVMHGDEGAGKNLFWGALRDIYGVHGGIVSQQQLQGQFNSWLSAKLFVILNEVVTKQEMRHHIGYLKTLITEPEIYINRKMVDERRESNHCNFVFLSNELQPVLLAPGDRRMMVIWTPRRLDDEAYYAAVKAELASGGVAALFDHLMRLDLEGFNEHTKPMMTAAKSALIEYSMPSPQSFWKELHDGVLPLPYCPALTDDVYAAYVVWCGRNGEFRPRPKQQFGPDFARMNGVWKTRKRLPNPDQPQAIALITDRLQYRNVYVMGERATADEQAEEMRIRRAVAEFRVALRGYLADNPLRPGTARDGAQY